MHTLGGVARTYRYNFQPVFTFHRSDEVLFSAVVYGAYRDWDPVPQVIADVLNYGKPDIILYDRGTDRIFFAVEETAAVPTGNQSLQRLERVSFAAEQRIPFVYLVSEYGMHLDGGARRTSIWPSVLALKLSSQFKVPSLTLFYGDASHLEDYSVGTGVMDLAKLSNVYVRDWLGENVRAEKETLIARIVKEMGAFILTQVDEISPLLPGRKLLTNDDFLRFMADRVAEYDA